MTAGKEKKKKNNNLIHFQTLLESSSMLRGTSYCCLNRISEKNHIKPGEDKKAFLKAVNLQAVLQLKCWC